MSRPQIEQSKKIDGLMLLTPSVYEDLRGEFAATYTERDYVFYDSTGQRIVFLEDDLAVSRYSVLRGLHGDKLTWKLIQCVAGEAYFVAADMRRTSSTYLNWEAFMLTESNHRQVLVPAGCASGMQCISSRCTIAYKQSRLYESADHQFSVRWDEPRLAIYWPISNPILSERDRTAPYLTQHTLIE